MGNPSIICTIGPSCDKRSTLIALKKAGVDIFRVNLSHSTLEDLENYIKIGSLIGIKIGLDTEGAQLRTKLNKKNISLKKGEKINIYQSLNKNIDNCDLGLYPPSFLSLISKGSILRLDFNGALIRIVEKQETYIECECIGSGLVGNNKGADILNGTINLPDFTNKDIKALEICNNYGISNIFISFCKSEEAVIKAKSFVKDAYIFSKIESKLSINNLEEICKQTDAILIDRGDLTREINIMDIPFAQRGIIKVAQNNNKPCYIATNVLESLINSNLPTRAELNDIIGSLEMGAEGFVLAAETAIGRKPILCVEIVRELMHRFDLYKVGLLFADTERSEITDEEMRIWLNRLKT